MKEEELLDSHSRLARWRGLRLMRVLKTFLFLATLTSIILIFTIYKFKKTPFKNVKQQATISGIGR
jgi:hypothetical protein